MSIPFKLPPAVVGPDLGLHEQVLCVAVGPAPALPLQGDFPGCRWDENESYGWLTFNKLDAFNHDLYTCYIYIYMYIYHYQIYLFYSSIFPNFSLRYMADIVRHPLPLPFFKKPQPSRWHWLLHRGQKLRLQRGSPSRHGARDHCLQQGRTRAEAARDGPWWTMMDRWNGETVKRSGAKHGGCGMWW